MLKKKEVLNQRYSRNGLNSISCNYRWTLGKVPSELTVQGFQVQGGVSTICWCQRYSQIANCNNGISSWWRCWRRCYYTMFPPSELRVANTCHQQMKKPLVQIAPVFDKKPNPCYTIRWWHPIHASWRICHLPLGNTNQANTNANAVKGKTNTHNVFSWN